MMHFNSTRMFKLGSLASLATSVAFVCMVAGCKSPDKIELLEARLRENEVVVQNYERELGSMNSQLSVAQREAKILREQLDRNGQPVPAVEATTALASVETLKFNTLLTAGQDKDSQPGDEKFHAIVSPYDSGGEIVKVIGDVELEAVDLSLPENQRTIGKWNYSPEEALKLWHAGYLSTGYRFELPWKSLPQGNEVVLRMKMKTPDGRELVTSHTVKVQPPAQLAVTEPATDLVPPPTEIIQTSVSDSESSTSEENKPKRPEPVLDLLEATSTGQAQEPSKEDKTASVKVVPISFEKKQAIQLDSSTDSTARPFPDGIKTSDTQSEYSFSVVR
jgi:hypothetical protein